MSEDDVRVALDVLAEMSLLRPSSVNPDEYRVVSPEVGLATLLARTEAELQKQQHRIETVRAAISILSAEHRDAYDRQAVVRHDGIDSVRSRIESLAAATTEEVVSLNPWHAQTPQAKEASRPLNEVMLSRGIRIRCIYQESVRNRPMLDEYSRWLMAVGGEVRTAPLVPMLMIVYDSQTVLLPIDPNHTELGALELSMPSVVTAMRTLFEQLWSMGTPYAQSAHPDDHGLSPTERSVLVLLEAGQTDAVVARRLGLSLRTVRRIMSDLMSRLGARSRFQAGVHVAEAGWLGSGRHSPTSSASTPAGADLGASTARPPAANIP